MHMHLSQETIKAIRSLGLDISDTPFFGADHRAFPGGYIVIKPIGISGNHVPGWEGWFTSYQGMDDQTDAPSIYVYFLNGEWQYQVSLYAPGPGPGEFRRSVPNEHELVARIHQYYFTTNEDFDALLHAKDSR